MKPHAAETWRSLSDKDRRYIIRSLGMLLDGNGRELSFGRAAGMKQYARKYASRVTACVVAIDVLRAASVAPKKGKR